jgi:signal transduction histidine kinase
MEVNQINSIFNQDFDILGEALANCQNNEQIKSVMLLAADRNHPTKNRPNPLPATFGKLLMGSIFPEIIHQGKKWDEGFMMIPLNSEPMTTVINLSGDSKTAGLSKIANLLKPETAKYAEYITQSAEKINELVEQLFHYSQSGNYLLQFNPTPLNLRAIVKEIFSFYLQMANQKSVQLHADIPESMEVEADNYMMNTMLRNLIGNAIKFSYQNGNVRVSATKTSAQTIVAVKDEGMGMSAEIRKNLFTINKQGGREGTAGEVSTSLGLKLCKTFIETHGGEIRAESTENNGTTFYCSLPDIKISNKTHQNH